MIKQVFEGVSVAGDFFNRKCNFVLHFCLDNKISLPIIKTSYCRLSIVFFILTGKSLIISIIVPCQYFCVTFVIHIIVIQ